MKTNFNLQKLISEELNGLINESYIMEHENFKFRQEIKNSSSFITTMNFHKIMM